MKEWIIGLSALIVVGAFGQSTIAQTGDFRSAWSRMPDQVWVGADYWTNPMQDWRVDGGRLECHVSGGDRSVALLSRELADRVGTIDLRVTLGQMDLDQMDLGSGWVGFRIGSQGRFGDYRDSAVRGTGLDAGLYAGGRLFIGQWDEAVARVPMPFENITLHLKAAPLDDGYSMVIRALDADGNELSRAEREKVHRSWLTGGIALVCSNESAVSVEVSRRRPMNVPSAKQNRGGSMRFWFSNFTLGGTKVDRHDDRAWGPILFCQHTLHRGIVKLTTQLAPVDFEATRVSLRVESSDGRTIRTITRSDFDPLARTATFRLTELDPSQDWTYRVQALSRDRDGREVMSEFAGTIRADPLGQDVLTVAAFTGNNDVGFPHQDIVEHVSHFKPDVLVYTGDQLYEGVGGYGIQRQPLETATLDYLRKWYMFGWEYGEMLRDTPSVCLPDDHDVYHGNIWGAGGVHASPYGQAGQDKGGYTMDAQWVNMVQRTQTSHHPDPYDSTPIAQDISVYYGPWNYGGLSFAIIEDRKFKSAPGPMMPDAKIRNGWAQNPDWDAATQSDVVGAVLLGERQESFLEDWAGDWSHGAQMKAVVSQTIFANVVTLPESEMSDANTPRLRVGEPGEYAVGEKPVQDHDSNAWPQTPRNDALRAMRKAFAFHIAGDQHLGSTIQYGVEAWHDAGWAICVPSVANVWPRRWFPPEPGRNHVEGMPRYTGDYFDGFGNRVSVHAVSNPEANGIEPTNINHRAPGYGIVQFNTRERTITVANWPRWVDPATPNARPYPGWPIVIDQLSNGGFDAMAFRLPTIKVIGPRNAVLRVIDEASGETVYSIRINGDAFEPRVRRDGSYRIDIGDPDRRTRRTIIGIPTLDDDEIRTIDVRLSGGER